MNHNFELLETVISRIGSSDSQVISGDLGTIVEIYSEPTLAYDVEFVNPDGSTRALLTLTPEQIRKLEATDVITTRRLSVAA